MRKTAYVAVSALALLFALALAIAFASGHFRTAWVFALLIALSMETRVQVGGRLPRTALLWTHLAFAIPFLVAVSVLAFWFAAAWLQALAALLFIGMAGTASVLWYRGLASLAGGSAREGTG